MIYLNLKSAFKKEGCPVCRLLKEQEDRYFFNLLYENVNDGPTRGLIIDSMGLCPEHAWTLQARELEEWNDGLGTGIIYEDLTKGVLNEFSAYLGPVKRRLLKSRNSRNDEQESEYCHPPAAGFLARAASKFTKKEKPAEALAGSVSKKKECHICKSLKQSENAYIEWLVNGLNNREFREAYLNSDGLCLPHLRQAIKTARDKYTAYLLVEKAESYLKALDKNLKEYIRKHAWDFRQEPKYAEEEASWIRAVAFFAGEYRGNSTDRAVSSRDKALKHYSSYLRRNPAGSDS